MSAVAATDRGSTPLRWKVFLSSAFKELRKYRDAVHQAYEKDLDLSQRIDLIEMEDAIPRAHAAESYCEGLVRDSDLMILLVGNRLGSMIPGMKWTYTEWEFFTAREIGLPLLYVPLSVDASDLQDADGEPDKDIEMRVADLRGAVAAQRTTRPGDRLLAGMQNPGAMAGQLIEALRQWLEADATPTRLAVDRRFVGRRDEYRRLRASIDRRNMSVIAGPPGTGKSALADALRHDPDVRRVYRPLLEVPIVADYQTSPAELKRKILGSVLSDLCADHGIPDPQDSSSSDLESLKVAIRSTISDPGPGGVAIGTPLVLVRIGPIWGGRDSDDGAKNARAIADACLTLPALVRTVVETSDERIVTRLQLAQQQNPGDEIRPLNLSPRDGLDFLYSLGDSGQSAGVLHGFDRDTGIPCAFCAQGGQKLSEHLGGSPQLLAIAGRTLRRNTIHPDLLQVDQLLRTYMDIEDIGYATLEIAIGRLGDSERKALIAASALLPKPYTFSAAAVAAMCHDAGGTGNTHWHELSDGQKAALVVEWKESLKHLQERCLIEGAEGDREESEQAVFRIHPNISFAVQHWCETTDHTAQLKALRDRGFEYYDKHLIDFLESSSLRGWYQLENAVWSGPLLDWLHLLMYSDGRGKDIGAKMEALVRLYLKAHWWWGGYVTFPLSDDLVDFARQRTDVFADRARAQQAEGNNLTPSSVTALANALDGFDTDYPKLGNLYIPPGPHELGPLWSQVAVYIAQMADLLRIPMYDGPSLDPGPEELNDWRVSMRGEIREYLHVFSAHAERFGCGQRPLPADVIGRIEVCYQVAIDLATHDKDLWNLSWYAMERADAWLDAMELETAWKKCRDAEDATRSYEAEEEDHDFELWSNIERVYGDTRWEQGDRSQAWDHYLRALYYGIATQLYPHCDSYTIRFYEEQMWRASGRLLETARLSGVSPGAEVLGLVRRTRAAFGLTDVPDAELADVLAAPDTPTSRQRLEALFPRKPPKEHRWTSESDYVTTARRLLVQARAVFPDLPDPPEGYR